MSLRDGFSQVRHAELDPSCSGRSVFHMALCVVVSCLVGVLNSRSHGLGIQFQFTIIEFFGPRGIAKSRCKLFS
jgi:hypothetical protein